MGKFVDSCNRSWEPEINVITIGRVRTALKINLLEVMLPNSTLPEKLTDPCLLVDILYLLCKEQVDKINLSPEDFGRTMTPDGIEAGWEAVLEGIVNFSPRGLRPAHRKVLEKAKQYQEKATEQIANLVANPEFDLMLDREMQKRLNPQQPSPNGSSGDATSLPASSELTPVGTPSLP